MIDVRNIKEVRPLVIPKNFEGFMEFLLIAQKRRKTIVEVPIIITNRKYGISKLGIFRSVIDYTDSC